MEHKNTRKYSKQAIRIARAFTMAALMSEHVAACLFSSIPILHTRLPFATLGPFSHFIRSARIYTCSKKEWTDQNEFRQAAAHGSALLMQNLAHCARRCRYLTA